MTFGSDAYQSLLNATNYSFCSRGYIQFCIDVDEVSLYGANPNGQSLGDLFIREPQG